MRNEKKEGKKEGKKEERDLPKSLQKLQKENFFWFKFGSFDILRIRIVSNS